MLVYPAMFGHSDVTTVCNTSSAYDAGECQLGWSYMLAIAGAAIGLFCPYLARHIDVYLEELDPPELLHEIEESTYVVPDARTMRSHVTMSSFKSSSTQDSLV